MSNDPEFAEFVDKMRWLMLWLVVSCIAWFAVGFVATTVIAEILF